MSVGMRDEACDLEENDELVSLSRSSEREEIKKIQENYKKDQADFVKKKNNEMIKQLKELTQQMKDRNTAKKWQKTTFFVVIMGLFVVLTVTPYAVLLCFRDSVTEQSILAMIFASLIELVSAIIVMPRIIAEYLYDKDEEKNMTELLTKLYELEKEEK